MADFTKYPVGENRSKMWQLKLPFGFSFFFFFFCEGLINCEIKRLSFGGRKGSLWPNCVSNNHESAASIFCAEAKSTKHNKEERSSEDRRLPQMKSCRQGPKCKSEAEDKDEAKRLQTRHPLAKIRRMRSVP